MRQVPRYAVIGNGRMAQHICHYFDALGLAYENWSRSQQHPSELSTILEKSTHILILITDSQIEPFITEYLGDAQYASLIKIHFSGSLASQMAYSAHPLQTFSGEHYNLAEYEAVPFILEKNSPNFEILLPGLKNPHYRISANDKAYYHALCVMSGNFTTLLWQKFFQEMERRFQIPHENLIPYLHKITQNLSKNSKSALTGPIARKDKATLSRNLSAFYQDDFQPIFKAFVETFVPEMKDEIHS